MSRSLPLEHFLVPDHAVSGLAGARGQQLYTSLGHHHGVLELSRASSCCVAIMIENEKQ